ncbi:MAG: hypothetical protein H0W72_14515 [Planctomycetes bacterium]|nr:hypothetical protein [Planctomycetota bacterium]
MGVELEDEDTELDEETASAAEAPEAPEAKVDDADEDADDADEGDGDAVASGEGAVAAQPAAPRAATPLPAQVKSRIAQCLRERLVVLDGEIAQARQLVEREHFFDGFLRVLEQRHRRWSATLLAAEQAPVLP